MAAVFTAAGDESDGPQQTGPFVYGGLVAPTKDWVEWFAPAWEERVLNIGPPIDYFHMTEIRNPKWQAERGLTDVDAQRRIDEAVRIVASMGSLHLLRTRFDSGHFRRMFNGCRIRRTDSEQFGSYRFEPDYVGFLGFARAALHYVSLHHPDAERVDFLVERKKTISHYMPDYLDAVVDWLTRQGRTDLVQLIGELLPGGKNRVPLQAADLAMWHVRRHEAGESEPIDIRRLGQMFDGRRMTLSGMTNDEISEVAHRIAARQSTEGDA